MIDRLVDAGLPGHKSCCRVLGVTSPGYYRYKNRPTSATQLRREWLTGLISEVHLASRGTYGYRRVHAELTMAMKVQVSSRLISVLMTQAGIYGLPGPARIKRLRGVVTSETWSTASSTASRPTSCGSPTSPNTPPVKARSSALPSWTPTAAGSWAGRSTPAKTAPW